VWVDRQFVKMLYCTECNTISKQAKANRLRRCGHVLRKEDNDWVKKCMQYEAEGSRSRGNQRGPAERWWKRTVKHVN